MACRRTGPCLLALLVTVLLVAPSSEKKLLKLALLMSGGTTFIPIPVPLQKKVQHTKLVPFNMPYPVPVPVHTHEHMTTITVEGTTAEDTTVGGHYEHYSGGHYGGGYY
ncbi:hypothetical protein MRX96_001634 [Rhipicephalus microplus]